MRLVLAFVMAVVVTHVVGTIASAEPHLRWLASQGMPVDSAVRLDAYGQAVFGMLPLYAVLCAVALLVGFFVTWLIVRRVRWLSGLGYALGGFAAMVALFAIMNAALELTGVPSTRTLGGLLAQGVAGGLGGFAFHLLKSKAQPSSV